MPVVDREKLAEVSANIRRNAEAGMNDAGEHGARCRMLAVVEAWHAWHVAEVERGTSRDDQFQAATTTLGTCIGEMVANCARDGAGPALLNVALSKIALVAMVSIVMGAKDENAIDVHAGSLS